MTAFIPRLCAILLISSCAVAAETPVRVTLDFSKTLMQLDASDGASVCQFHGSDPVKGTVHADRSYATLGGFPDDAGNTEFRIFCDTAFSTKHPSGMGLNQIWSTPTGLQSPPGSLSDHYNEKSWNLLDFGMYESGMLRPERFLGRNGSTVRGHTVPMMLAALRRARAERQRILFWSDLHTDYPHWMWQDGLRRNPISEQYWEEASLHIAYFVKYLSARHGIPIHAVSFQNEPDLPARHGFSPAELVKASRVLRAKLDEAGLTGVRIIPFTSMTLNTTAVPWMKGRVVDTIERVVSLLEGPMRGYASNIDYLGGHLSHSEPPFQTKLPNVRFWRASGDFDNHWRGPEHVTFDMGPADQIDEVIRQNTYLYGQGVSLAGIWQVALRMGHTVDNFVLPSVFDVDKNFRREAIAGAATVNPFVRPGMFLVSGSQGAEPRAAYSVDAFNGRGRREAIVITNSTKPRTFELALHGASKLRTVEVFQATPGADRRSLGVLPVKNGMVSIEVPADSVTSLVAVEPSTRPSAVLVTKDAAARTKSDREIIRVLSRRAEVTVVSQVLSPDDQTRLATKRHPVDPMGAAVYVLSDSVDNNAAALAHRIVMAPAVVIGARNQAALGVRSRGRIAAGESLAARHPLDPPASLLDGGLPKATGARTAWDRADGLAAFERALDWALAQ